MEQKLKHPGQNWLFRFVKGMFIGSGFIIPGVSGGALAAIFGVYQQIITFLANPFKKLKENILFFIPIGLGALFGIGILAWGVSYLLQNYQTIVSWFFVGAVVGTLPALWQEAGSQGRTPQSYLTAIIAFIAALALLFYGNQLFTEEVPAHFISWMVCGGLIALGILIPGLSPSNFILYMGLYEKMSDGFKHFDLSVIIPIGLGGIVILLALAKLIEWIFNHYYTLFFHFIFGVVVASTLMIIPTHYPASFGWVQYAFCVGMLVLGTALGHWMTQLEAKYK